MIYVIFGVDFFHCNLRDVSFIISL